MLHNTVCNHIARVYDVLVSGLEVDLVNQTFAGQGQEAAAGCLCIAPVGEGLFDVSVLLWWMWHGCWLTIFRFTLGINFNPCPVHASNAFR